jgi:hypothetical protein
MCLRCAGWSDDQIARRYARLIAEHGWTAVAVDAGVPWTYTMGLRWRHRHPELIVVGIDPLERPCSACSLAAVRHPEPTS